jgi:hypothetical protein
MRRKEFDKICNLMMVNPDQVVKEKKVIRILRMRSGIEQKNLLIKELLK